MSDYHILGKSVDNRFADVYVHLPVPATNTAAGITYQQALAESLTGQDVTAILLHAVQFLGENAQLVSGEQVEVHVRFRFDDTDLTNLERRDQIEHGNGNQPGGVIQMKLDIAIQGSDLWNEILEPLEWWGYDRDIP